VTVRVPLPDGLEIRHDTLVESLATHLPVTVTLARFEDRSDALVAVAEPDDELRRLTAAFDEFIPGLPPHRGGRADLSYHATVIRTRDPDLRRAAVGNLAARLPLTEAADELCLFEWFGRDLLRVLWRSGSRLVH
jgi:hypothetical protein